LEKDLAELSKASLVQIRDDLLAHAEKIADISVFAALVDTDAAQLKELSDLIEEKARPAVILLLAEVDGKGIAVCKVSDNLPANAGVIMRALTSEFGGGGGGNRVFAQGGGLRADSLEGALEKGRETIRTALA
ncbi:hypothetical protein J7K60_01405, partial [Candidatus Bipolaricaulota bacterium]|nr:hypothetical protein [Candidatus Bipolaricaulota bacterium]